MQKNMDTKHVDFANGVPIIDLVMLLQKAKSIQKVS